MHNTQNARNNAMTSLNDEQRDLPPHSDNVQEELRRIRMALSTVFSPAPTPSGQMIGINTENEWFRQRQLADRYLTSFQSTTISWMVCDTLLQDGEQTHESQSQRFFAAQTLHTKCRNEIHELPLSTLPSLRDSLINHLIRSTSENFKALTTRLALCACALAVQMQWNTIITDLLHQQCRELLLPIFRVLPEETSSDRLILEHEEWRYQMRDHLVTCAPEVFQYLQSLTNSSSNNQQQMSLEVFHAWIRYVPVNPSALLESPLLPASVQVLYSFTDDLLEYAADVVVEVLRMYPSHHIDNEPLVKFLVPLLSRLPLEQALSQDDNEDAQRSYCRIVTEMGESCVSLILSRKDQAMSSQLVQWVLRCSRVPDQDIASITLHFWYRLVVDLEVMEPYEWRQELIDVHAPYLLELISICVTSLMRYPIEEQLNHDQLDDINRHRYYVAETIEDSCRLLGGQLVITRLNEHLKTVIFTGEWQGIESCLACICAIHRFVPNDENALLPSCFRLIPQLPVHVALLRYTACQSIGKFSSWLAVHAQYLQPLLPYLAQSLNVPEAAPAAAVAIKELCDCSNQNFAIAEPVLQLYIEVNASGRLELLDELQILQGVCRALSRLIQDTQDNENGTAFLSRLIQPIGSHLALKVDNPSSSPRRLIPDIERLTVVVKYLTIAHIPSHYHPIIDLTLSTWPLLEAATSRFPHDNLLAEAICRLYKHALRSTGASNFAPLVEPLVKQLVQGFERTQQAPFLYAASIVVTEYGPDANYSKIILDMVNSLARTAFSFIRLLEDMTNHPDVVEEFFYLMERMMSYCPVLLVQSSLLLSLYRCAAVCMEVDHGGVNKSTLKFLETSISYGLSIRADNNREYLAVMKAAWTQEGQSIVKNLVYSMVGDLPWYSDMGQDILRKLHLLCPREVAQWLASSFESVTLPERIKNDFLGALATDLPKDEFSLAAGAFQSACLRERRFKRSIY